MNVYNDFGMDNYCFLLYWYVSACFQKTKMEPAIQLDKKY
ncbi:hypothetical protein Lp90_1015 [Lactiplantibacillus plantarum]|nr:hypothetical protein Lp90_1015 [Lactiplantibacillus plantarum]